MSTSEIVIVVLISVAVLGGVAFGLIRRLVLRDRFRAAMLAAGRNKSRFPGDLGDSIIELRLDALGAELERIVQSRPLQFINIHLDDDTMTQISTLSREFHLNLWASGRFDLEDVRSRLSSSGLDVQWGDAMEDPELPTIVLGVTPDVTATKFAELMGVLYALDGEDEIIISEICYD